MFPCWWCFESGWLSSVSRMMKVPVMVWGVWFSHISQREASATGGRKVKRGEQDLEIEFGFDPTVMLVLVFLRYLAGSILGPLPSQQSWVICLYCFAPLAAPTNSRGHSLSLV